MKQLSREGDWIQPKDFSHITVGRMFTSVPTIHLADGDAQAVTELFDVLKRTIPLENFMGILVAAGKCYASINQWYMIWIHNLLLIICLSGFPAAIQGWHHHIKTRSNFWTISDKSIDQ